MDYAKIVKDGFIWLGDTRLLKLLGLIFAVNFGFYVVDAVLGTILLGANYSKLSSAGIFSGGVKESIVFAGASVIYSAISSGLQLIVMFLQVYLSALFIIRLLELMGFSPPKLSINKFVRYVFSSIWAAIMIVTSWYIKPLFAYFIILAISFPIIFVLILANPIAGGAALAIWAILALVYCIPVIYNSLRISFAQSQIFLEREVGVRESSRLAWEMTKGHVVEAFITSLIFIPLVAVFIAVVFGIALAYAFLTAASGNVFFGHVFLGFFISLAVLPYAAIVHSMTVSFYSQLSQKNAVPARVFPGNRAAGAFVRPPAPRRPAKKLPAKKR